LSFPCVVVLLFMVGKEKVIDFWGYICITYQYFEMKTIRKQFLDKIAT